MIGVQRSSISHILSGRNRPSLDFVQKILKVFPDIRSEWLVMGKGPMYEKPDPDYPAQRQGELFDHPGQQSSGALGPPNSLQDEEPLQYKAEPEQKTEPIEQESGTAKTEKKGGGAEGKPAGKAIKKILLVYEDNSFDELHPSE